jgi:hypothetical protein
MPRGVGIYERAVIQRHLWSRDGLGAPIFTQFNPGGSPWTISQATSTAATISDPERLNGSYKLAENTATALHYFSDGRAYTSGQVYTFLYLVKAAERTWAYTDWFNGATDFLTFYNLSTGVVGSSVLGGATPGGAVTPLGDGWNLIVAQPTGNGAGNQIMVFGIGSADGTYSYAGTTGNGIYVFKPTIYARALSQAEIDRVAGSYAWGIVAYNNALPAVHPYKTRPPLISD